MAISGAAPHIDEFLHIPSTSRPAPISMPTPVQYPEPKTPQIHNEDANADSEDDTPLSMLSKVTDDEDNGPGAMNNGTKRMRSPSPPVFEANRSKRRNVSLSFIGHVRISLRTISLFTSSRKHFHPPPRRRRSKFQANQVCLQKRSNLESYSLVARYPPFI